MPILPVYDHNTLKYIGFQRVTAGLIALNVLVYVWQTTLTGDNYFAAFVVGGLTPAAWFTDGFDAAVVALPPGWAHLPEWATLLTYMFLHGDIWHLAGNMLFLWVFGDNVEDSMGHTKFLIFYLLCGVAAGLAHAYAVAPPVASGGSAGVVPLIGASGATAGLVGAYLMLHPRARMWCVILMRVPLRLPAVLVIAAWVAVQIFFVVTKIAPEVAWWAHIGGFVLGAALAPVFKRPDVKLLSGGEDRTRAAQAPAP